jgi:hypothetical protein
VFHWNNYDELWSAIPRELYVKYWDNDEVEGVLKSKSISTLMELICRGDEFINSIK